MPPTTLTQSINWKGSAKNPIENSIRNGISSVIGRRSVGDSFCRFFKGFTFVYSKGVTLALIYRTQPDFTKRNIEVGIVCMDL